MGSDVGARVPPLDPAAARARRSLAAARAARDGITTMVDALRVSKPPRAPPKTNGGVASSVPAARRHALIPLAEGRPELEARIRALEDAVASREADLVRLKRQWGRALVKRRHLEKDLDATRSENVALRDVARAYSAVGTSSKKRLQELVDDVAVPLPALHAAVADASSLEPQLAEDIVAALDDIEEVLATARDSMMKQSSLPAIPQAANGNGTAIAMLAHTPRPRLTRGASSTAGSDDDAKSCASFASSAGFGDDRETQLEALVELVEILEAKISSAPQHVGGNAALGRAKRTLASSRLRDPAEISDVVTERDQLKRQLEAVMAEKESVGGEDAAMALAARAEAELRDAKKEIATMSERIASLEKIATRAVQQDGLSSRNAELEGELRSAKKTVGRLVQERNALRRTAPGSGVLSNSSNSNRPRPRGHPDAVRRILDWRQRASTESVDSPASRVLSGYENGNFLAKQEPNHNHNLATDLNKAEPLPDRATPAISGGGSLKKRRMEVVESESVNANDVQSVSERSLDVGVNDSISAQSVPVRGFLRRHDSFLSAGNVSAAGDEITITNNRNIFNTAGRSMDGLRGLLGGP